LFYTECSARNETCIYENGAVRKELQCENGCCGEKHEAHCCKE